MAKVKEPEVAQKEVEEIESGPMVVPVVAPINPCGHKWVIVELVTCIRIPSNLCKLIPNWEYIR